MSVEIKTPLTHNIYNPDIWKETYELTIFILNKIGKTLNGEDLIIQNAIQREINFYNKVMSKLVEFLETDKKAIILFDIDETIVSYEDNIDRVRPIFLKLVQDLKLKFNDIKIWILTGRWEENIKKQIKKWSLSHIKYLFDLEYIFSSRDSSWINSLDQRFKSNEPWNIQKINVMYDLKITHSNTKFILVDDRINEDFEDLWEWIIIWKNEYFVHWELIWISK